MAEPTLLLDAALALVSALVFAQVGRASMRRRIQGDGRLAATLFGVWWNGLAAILLANAIMRVLAFAGVTDLNVFLTLMYVNALVLCVALWALLYYLVYLFTGNKELMVPISAFYVACYAFLMYFVTYQRPASVRIEPWEIGINFERELTGAPVVMLVLLIMLPPVLGAINYARLYRRVTDPTQKYRIGLISLTIIAWFGSALVAYTAGMGDQIWWSVGSRIVALAAAWLIYIAYRPPAWVRARYGIRAIDAPART